MRKYGWQHVLANLFRPEISDSNSWQTTKRKTDSWKKKIIGILGYEKVAKMVMIRKPSGTWYRFPNIAQHAKGHQLYYSPLY